MEPRRRRRRSRRRRRGEGFAEGSTGIRKRERERGGVCRVRVRVRFDLSGRGGVTFLSVHLCVRRMGRSIQAALGPTPYLTCGSAGTGSWEGRRILCGSAAPSELDSVGTEKYTKHGDHPQRIRAGPRRSSTRDSVQDCARDREEAATHRRRVVFLVSTQQHQSSSHATPVTTHHHQTAAAAVPSRHLPLQPPVLVLSPRAAAAAVQISRLQSRATQTQQTPTTSNVNEPCRPRASCCSFSSRSSLSAPRPRGATTTRRRGG